MKKYISLENLSRFYTKLKGTTLDTMEEIQANQTSGKIAGALAVKELNKKVENFSMFLDYSKTEIIHNSPGATAATSINYMVNSDGILTIGSYGRNIPILVDGNTAFISFSMLFYVKDIIVKKGQKVTCRDIDVRYMQFTPFL